MSALRISAVATLLLTVSVGGCFKASNAKSRPPAGKIVLHGAGSTFAAPLYREWIKSYRNVSSGVWVEYDAVGSGEGQKRFISGEVDFGASDARLDNEQLASVEGGVVTVPVAGGGVVLAYNSRGLVDGMKLPRDVYPDIFLGKIKYWNDSRIAAANPGVALPNIPIVLVVRADGSGTTNAFTSHLSAISESWRNGPGAGKEIHWPSVALRMSGNDRVAGAIVQTHGAVGYVEYGTARGLGLPMAAVENLSGEFVLPSTQSIQVAVADDELESGRDASVDPPQKSAYPIVTNTWLFVRKRSNDQERAGALAGFLIWCLTEGQGASESLGYVRLSQKRSAEAVKLATTISEVERK